MSKILFLNQPTVGHLNTLLAIALQMQAEGHQVQFLVPGLSERPAALSPLLPLIHTASSIPIILAKHGLPVEIIRMQPSLTMLSTLLRLPLTSGYEEFVIASEIFTHQLADYTRDILKYIDRTCPDVLVTDFAFPAAAIAAEAASLPYVTIYHSGLPFTGPLIPPFASGLAIGTQNASGSAIHQKEQTVLSRLDERMNSVRRRYGLTEIAAGLLRRPYSPWLNLVASVEAIEAPRDNLTPNTLYIGPCFSTRQQRAADDFPFEQLRPDAYKVYVSLGTVFNNKPHVFHKIMRGLDLPEHQVIVSAGGAYKCLAAQGYPANVLLFPRVPQVDLLPRVDLVIGHGGNNSTNETLAAGKPLIILPVGGEQGDNASRVLYLGAGRRLEIERFTPKDVREMVAQLRADPIIPSRLANIKKAIAETHGPQTASLAVAWVARHQRPLTRRPGASLTCTSADIVQHFQYALGESSTN